MTHTDAVNLLRAAPKTVRLVLGRVLELPKKPVLPHLLPDITLTCHKELGNAKQALCDVIFLASLKISILKAEKINIFYSLKVFPCLEVTTVFIE